jgi:hypothetical protein
MSPQGGGEGVRKTEASTLFFLVQQRLFSFPLNAVYAFRNVSKKACYCSGFKGYWQYKENVRIKYDVTHSVLDCSQFH